MKEEVQKEDGNTPTVPRKEKAEDEEGEEDRNDVKEQKNISPQSINHNIYTTTSMSLFTPHLPSDQVSQALGHTSQNINEGCPSAISSPGTSPRREFSAVRLDVESKEDAEKEGKEDSTLPPPIPPRNPSRLNGAPVWF